MSEGTNIELAYRDIGIEIEKLVADRDMFKADWQAMVKQIDELRREIKYLMKRAENAV